MSFCNFFSFLPPVIFISIVLYFKIVLFLAVGPGSGFGAGFGEEKLLSCQRNVVGFHNLVLANCGVAASQLLCVAVVLVVPWFSAARCLRRAEMV